MRELWKSRFTRRSLMAIAAILTAGTAMGLNPTHAESRAADDPDFSLVKVKGKAVYSQTNKDRCDFEGWIKNLPAGWTPEGAVLDFHIAGAWIQVTLDEKGKNNPALDAGGTHKFRMKWNFKKDFPGGDIYFKLKSKGTWQPAWEDDGITPDRETKKEQITMPADFQLDSHPRVFTNFSPLLTSKPQRTAKFILFNK